MQNQLYHNRKGHQKAHRALYLLMVLAFSFGLGGCGKKPGHVDPPPNVSEDTFPLTYPDPETDPKP